MITLPPYITEWQAYTSVPPKDRWIFSKIELGQRLGNITLPVGLKYQPGTYCVRPDINLQGAAKGGFRKVTLNKEAFIQGSPGYCVTPWLSDMRHWRSYVNDVCVYAQRTYKIEGEIEHMEEYSPEGIVIPDKLTGISRYMLVEFLGDTVIDVGPRHDLTEVRQDVLDDYLTFNPDYVLPSWCTWGFGDKYRTRWDDDLQAWTHEEIEHD